MVSPDVISAVREATSLEELAREYGLSLRRTPSGWVAPCCFHDERTPSLHIHTSGNYAGRYKCFGCGAHGDCFSFIRGMERFTFGESLKYLAMRAGIELIHEDGGLGSMEFRARIEDRKMFPWWVDYMHSRARKLLDTEMLNGPPVDREGWEFCASLGRLSRHTWSFQDFRSCVTGRDREAWRRDISEREQLRAAWMELASGSAMAA